MKGKKIIQNLFNKSGGSLEAPERSVATKKFYFCSFMIILGVLDLSFFINLKTVRGKSPKK